jgi:hypothetical protein
MYIRIIFVKLDINAVCFCFKNNAARKQDIILSKQEASESNGMLHLSQLFLFQGSTKLHFLRAPEPTLNIRFSDNFYQNCSQTMNYDERFCLKRKWGSKVELAKLILNSENPLLRNRSL